MPRDTLYDYSSRPAKVAMFFEIDDTHKKSFLFRRKDGTPIPMTGMTPVVEVRKRPGHPTILATWDSETHFVGSDPDNGAFFLTVSREDAAAFAGRYYSYEFKLFDDTETRTYVEGPLIATE